MFEITFNVGNNFGDSLHFDGLPSKNDIIVALKELANARELEEYSAAYSRALEAAEIYQWPVSWTNCVEVGEPVMFPNYNGLKDYQSDGNKVYIRIAKINVRKSTLI